MLHLHNLRVRLQERRNRLYRTSHKTYGTELRYLLQFLESNPYTHSLLSALDVNTPVDFEQWEAEQSNREVQFPHYEAGRAKICYGILKQCTSQKKSSVGHQWLFAFSPDLDPNLDQMHYAFTEAIVDPFINFLHDQIDDGGNILYLVERFKLKTEWFRQEELYQLYQEDTSVGEASLDRELRASLFDGGIDYPFSQASSPSGKADVIAQLDTDEPLVLEVKVFDPSRSKDKRHLRQGFHQVFRYANDYNQSLGYLVIFNCSERRLAISLEEETLETGFSPRLTYGGKTFFVISIDLNPNTTSASKENPTSRLAISYQELTSG